MKINNLLITFCFLFITVQQSFSQKAGVPLSEYNALVDFYNNLDGNNWNWKTNWLDTLNHSVKDWMGVKVRNGHITSINIMNNKLSGQIPSSIDKLAFLDTLNLIYNNINSLPKEFGNLSNLLFVELYSNHLRSIPPELGNLSKLKWLGLGDNDLTGSIPKELGNLLSLENLYLSFNNFNSALPNELGNLQNLKQFISESSNLTGEIPSTFKNLSNLNFLHLSNNKLNGIIPKELGNLSELTTLDLDRNYLNGQIPQEIFSLSNLVTLNLSGNSITGELSAELANLTKLTTLNLSLNQISGVLPPELGMLSNLKYLYINHNIIEGPLPVELENLKKLEVFHLNANWLGKITDENTIRAPRQIPSNLQEITSLKSFRIGQNYLLFNDIEPIFSWSNFSNLTEFKYELQNGLHKDKVLTTDKGRTVKITIPNYIPAPSDTYVWYKDGIAIEGASDSVLIIDNVQLNDEGFYYCTISNRIATGLDIYVHSTTLKVNDVHGAGIPLSEYKALVDFYNSNNGENWRKKANWLDTINVTVSEWEGLMVIAGHVKEISMDTNNVSGSFPRSLYKLGELERIDFFMNNLSGSLPEDIDSLSNLQSLFLRDNYFEGEIPTSIGNLKNLYLLNITNNQLSGSMPSSIGEMNNLSFLELANNNLSGTVPSSFGNLTQLRFLDLSYNQLQGPLPIELKNLENLIYLNFDNNSIGQTISNKSTSIDQKTQLENNRQIPDELAGLIQMDTLYLGGNKLQFNDIEAIFSWDNYNDFKDFIYYPQDSIGTSRTSEKTVGENTTLFIDNYYPGPSDEYQWYKNNVAIPGANEKELELTNLQSSDSAFYYCKISNSVANELILTSRLIKLAVNEKENTNIPVREFNALKTFYETLGGSSWENQSNWLDTINGTVSDWFGITMDNRHVRKIDLSGNGLKGELPDIFSAFDSLSHLDVSNNTLHGNLPLLPSAKSGLSEPAQQQLSYLNISDNNYLFSDLEPVATELFAIDTFIYAPQQMLGTMVDTSIYKYTDLLIQFENYKAGEQDLQNWYKNNVLTSTLNQNFSIINASLQDSGIYRMEVTNPVFPDLTLKSAPYKLSVMIPVGVEDNELTNIKIYPNPAERRVFINTQNKEIDLTLFDITGTKIIEKPNFSSGWLDIENFPGGIYIFRFKINDTTLNKKVVFK